MEVKSPEAVIDAIFKGVYTNPDFEVPLDTPMNVGVGDMFAIPDWCVKDKKSFLIWFEPQFFSLGEAGCLYFSDLLRDSMEVLLKHPYLLPPIPRLGGEKEERRPLSLSSSIQEKIRTGFTSAEEIREFLAQVAIPNTSENAAFFFCARARFLITEEPTTVDKLANAFLGPWGSSIARTFPPTAVWMPEKEKKYGAQRISICRVLSMANRLEKLRNSPQTQDFLANIDFILGKGPSTIGGGEIGILAGLETQSGEDILPSDMRLFTSQDILDWAEVGKTIKDVDLKINGNSYFIPELQVGVKDGFEALLKGCRKASTELGTVNDMLRMRFIFENNTQKEQILKVLHDLQEEAKTRKNPEIEVNCEEKNYFTVDELKNCFPDVLAVDNAGGGQDIPTIRGGGVLDRIVIDENPHSGRDFQSLSATIKLMKGGLPFFAFEIQFLTREQYVNNEKAENPNNRFVFKSRQAGKFISRMNGIMTREEMISALEDYLRIRWEDEEVPEIIIGDKLGQGHCFDMHFSGDLHQKATTLFDFLLKEGRIISVDREFPEKAEGESTLFFLHKDVAKKVIELVDGAYPIKTLSDARDS